MTESANARISLRKRPKQARSEELVGAILEAATRVLEQEGAHRFTTGRVAEKAGVSIGSLYQYFPNKAAILFRLQSDEWQRTTAVWRSILEDARKPPRDRLRALVHAFIQSECDEAAVRVALGDAEPLYRDEPETRKLRAEGDLAMRSFLREALPSSPESVRAQAGVLLTATLSGAGKSFSESPRSAREIKIYADAMSDMFCAYLGELSKSRF